MIKDALSRERYAHTSEAIDFAALAGRRIGVIGAGASAFDNAATALEHGAAVVDLYCRRPKLPVINPNRWIEFTGFLRHFGDLDDAMKWRFMKLIFDMNQPPPQDAFERCARFDNFTLHLDSPIQSLALAQDVIQLKNTAGSDKCGLPPSGHRFRYRLRGASGARSHRTADRALVGPLPAAGRRGESLLSAYPYLSPYFQFTERVPGAAPYLKNIFCYTYAAMPSLACTAGISQLKFGARPHGFGITRRAFSWATRIVTLRACAITREPELDTSAFEAARRYPASTRAHRVSR